MTVVARRMDCAAQRLSMSLAEPAHANGVPVPQILLSRGFPTVKLSSF